MDKARQKTDQMLNNMERRIDRVYADSSALRRIERKYQKYMAMVDERTKKSYLEFQKESDPEHKAELKKVYMRQIQALTTQSKEYRRIVEEFTDILAEVNQKALDVVNQNMQEVYRLNYNQIAVDCRKVGIEVDGE